MFGLEADLTVLQQPGPLPKHRTARYSGPLQTREVRTVSRKASERVKIAKVVMRELAEGTKMRHDVCPVFTDRSPPSPRSSIAFWIFPFILTHFKHHHSAHQPPSWCRNRPTLF
jgi:hypothetical protein